MNDLVAGQIDSMCDLAPTVVPQIQAGTIRGLMLAQPERSPATPDVPTSKEAGIEPYLFTGWNAVFAPKGTPKEVVEKLSGALQAALADEAVRRRIEELGSLPPKPDERTPEHLRRVVRADHDKWGEVDPRRRHRAAIGEGENARFSALPLVIPGPREARSPEPTAPRQEIEHVDEFAILGVNDGGFDDDRSSAALSL